MLNFKHLRCFVAVAQEGTLSKAGGKIFLTPQTIGSQIKEFEARHGLKLFEIKGRNLFLTEAGKALLPLAQEALATGKKIEQQALKIKLHRKNIQTLNLGFSYDFSDEFILKIINIFYPKNSIKITKTTNDHLAYLLAKKEIDFCFTIGANEGFNCFEYKLGEIGLSIFANINLDMDFLNMDAVLMDEGSKIRFMLDEWAKKNEYIYHHSIETNSIEQTLNLLKTNNLWTISSEKIIGPTNKYSKIKKLLDLNLKIPVFCFAHLTLDSTQENNLNKIKKLF